MCQWAQDPLKVRSHRLSSSPVLLQPRANLFGILSPLSLRSGNGFQSDNYCWPQPGTAFI